MTHDELLSIFRRLIADFEKGKDGFPTATKLDEYLAMQMADVDRIIAKRRHLAALRAEMVERHKKEHAEFDCKASEFVGTCKHLLVQRHGDPSGGSDSHDECLICGHRW